MKPQNNFYDTLQVSRSATDADMRTAYKTLCQQFHPDRNLEDVAGAARKLLLVNKAHEVLSNPQARVEYDAWIGKKEPRRATEGFAPTAMEVSSGQTDFADTQPHSSAESGISVAAVVSRVVADPMPSYAMREPIHRSKPQEALDWLRERPLWLLCAVLACVLVIAFAPWLWRASFGAAKPVVPITPDLQPTYVEPAVEPVAAPVAVPIAPKIEPTPEPTPVVSDEKPVRKAKPQSAAAKRAAAAPKKAQEPAAPIQRSEPAPVAVPMDPGGHTGFAPKCRWVTPTKWSCE